MSDPIMQRLDGMQALTIGSLFSGYGGLDLAVEAALGASTAWVAEVEPWACRVLEERFPSVPNLGDVTTIDWSTVEPVDVIAGGSPCQDLSTAGRRAGMTEGTRSNLWAAMREAVAHLKPTYVVWENVRGAYSAAADSDLGWTEGLLDQRSPDQLPKKEDRALRALGRVLGDLSDLGYDATWCGVQASDVGAPHARFRVFVLAWRRDAPVPNAERDGRGDVLTVGEQPVSAMPTDHGAPRGAGDVALLPTPTASVANDGEDAKTWLARRERVKLTARNGNGMGMPLSVAVPLLPTPISSDCKYPGPADADRATVQLRAIGALLPTPTTQEAKTGPSQLLRNTPPLNVVVLDADRYGKYADAVERWAQLVGPPPAPTEPSAGKSGVRLAPQFVEWMMGLPVGWVTDVPGVRRTAALKMLGNGVVPQQAYHALEHMLDNMRQYAGGGHWCGYWGGCDDECGCEPCAKERSAR